eukprot:Nk52_evm26s279 gene=Nk52_evmTU26s279
MKRARPMDEMDMYRGHPPPPPGQHPGNDYRQAPPTSMAPQNGPPMQHMGHHPPPPHGGPMPPQHHQHGPPPPHMQEGQYGGPPPQMMGHGPPPQQHMQPHGATSGGVQSYPISSGNAATHVTVTVQPNQQMNTGASYQRLKVEDALSYLDQVKIQFSDHPQVYNQFLDIMKDFKSQSIDTPGVIGRVSTLFDGHPDLIRGFNTFLPPGYKIEVNQASHQGGHASSQQSGPMPPHIQHGPPGGQGPVHPQFHRPTPQQPDIRHEQNRGGSQKPVEFNHAINYVNKIKTRFAQQPEIYKAFLEILHTYQKEARSIKEVYAQVATLFRSHSDLLEEFSQFLPEAAPQASSASAQRSQSFGKGDRPSDHAEYQYKKPIPSSGLKTTLPRVSGSKSKKNQPPLPTPTTSVSAAVAKKLKGKVAQDFSIQEAAKAGQYEDFIFFDKVKRALNSKVAYENFLRCINLYTVEVLNRTELVSLVQGFLSKHQDLITQFKQFVGYKEPTDLAPKTSVMVKDQWQEIDYTACKRHGCSYRCLPKNYQLPKCSGRSAEEKAVLNDLWVSFPTWSEDSTFVTSRKNVYEESLYKCEDERYELDMVRECNLSLLKGLESVNKKISALSPDEIASFKLDKKLGTGSEVIPVKALSRLYGEKHHEVYEAMQNNPVVAVPVILKRVKEKDAEWQSAQREWLKIWREVHERNYLRSADHQALTFKGNDKKAMSTKNVILEIENRFGEEKERMELSGDSVQKPHLSMTFKDKSVFDDIAELLIAHIMRTSSNSNSADKEKIMNFLKNFIPDFFLFVDGKYPAEIEKPKTTESEESENVEASPRKKQKLEDSNDKAEVPSEPKVKPVSMAQNGEEADVAKPCTHPSEHKTHVFYGNNTWMVFFKLYHTLFERVEKLKNLSKKYSDAFSKIKDRKLPRNEEVAIALGVKKAETVEPEQYFETFMAKVKSVVEGNLDMPAFEESMREMFCISAYPTFTIDKLIQSINRQLQNIIADDACTRLLSLYIYEKARNQEDEHVKTAYRSNADAIIGGDENCYSFVHSRETMTVDVMLLDPEDLVTAPDITTVEEKWSYYVNKYVRSEGKSNIEVKMPFLKRCKKGDVEDAEEDERLEARNGLQCKICVNTFKMFYVENSSDYMYRCGQLSRSRDTLKDMNKLKHTQFCNWLNAKAMSNCSKEQAEEFKKWLEKGESEKECDIKKITRNNGLTVNHYCGPEEPETNRIETILQASEPKATETSGSAADEGTKPSEAEAPVKEEPVPMQE